MQKLTYVNLLNESVVFTSIAPYVFCSISGTGSTSIDTKEIKGAYQNGVTLTGYLHPKREVDVTIHLQGQTRANMYEERLSLSGILSPQRAIQGDNRARIFYENDHGCYWTWAVPTSGLPWGKRVGNYTTSTKIRFLCESPYWYTIGQQEVKFNHGESYFRLPFSFPISLGKRNFVMNVSNAGQCASPVEVYIYGHGETPSLVNETTGQALRLTSALPTGSVLYANSDPAFLRAIVTDSAGIQTNAFGFLSMNDPLSRFVLEPGINTLSYESNSDSNQTEIIIRWYDRYEGV